VHESPRAFDGFRVLHADARLIVLDKAPGLLSVPGIGPEKADCLVARAARRFPGARIVHRLDRDTSGVIVLALDAETHRALSIQFQERRTGKHYVAIVAGTPPRDSGEIDLPIRKDLDDPPRQIVDFEHGRPSVTRWRVLERGARAGDVVRRRADASNPIATSRADDVGATIVRGVDAIGFDGLLHLPDPLACARLELEPLTGRGHQLRLHLVSIGHPILGDDLYAPPELRPRGLRMLLHARELEFTHPGTNERVRFVAEPPF